MTLNFVTRPDQSLHMTTQKMTKLPDNLSYAMLPVWRSLTHPRVVVQLKDGSGAEEVEAAEGGRQHCQSVPLHVKIGIVKFLSYFKFTQMGI